jgi:hypothetical protein
MRFIVLFLCATALLCVVRGVTLSTYTGACAASPTSFNVDVASGVCYTIPRTGTCNTNPGCAQVLTNSNRDLAALVAVANCTQLGNSFIMTTGNLRYFSSANCTGIESAGPLNNPCILMSLCNTTNLSTGAFQNASPASSLTSDLLGLLF